MDIGINKSNKMTFNNRYKKYAQIMFGVCSGFAVFVFWLAFLTPLNFGTLPVVLPSPAQEMTDYTVEVTSKATEKNELTSDHYKSSNVKNDDVTSTASPYIDRRFYVNKSVEIKEKHKVLWWNEPGWMKGVWDKDVDMAQCTYTNCELIFDRKQFHHSSAVIYSIVDGGLGKHPPVTPQERNPDQAWVFYTLESPVHMQVKDVWSPHWKNVFNWSWTYRRDSELFHPYGELVTRRDIPNRNYTAIFKKKKKLAAWLVSHCNTYSEREKYVKILNKYAQVDIYGKCGKKAPDNIDELINSDYKFYLGFENSLCRDYVTEKFFHYYNLDTVTIVRGKFDYSAHLPNSSFINTADYSSIRDLARFMHKLGSNEEEYVKYLKVQDRYKVYEREFLYRNVLCDMCDKLNNLDKHRNTYSDVRNWTGLCFKANDLKE